MSTNARSGALVLEAVERAQCRIWQGPQGAGTAQLEAMRRVAEQVRLVQKAAPVGLSPVELAQLVSVRIAAAYLLDGVGDAAEHDATEQLLDACLDGLTPGLRLEAA